MSILFVGLGGALGAICRYLLSMISVKSDFPLMTFIINILGAIIIGFVVGVASKYKVNDNILLFLKTGFCGGFTTFSTFSLETLTLFENSHYITGCLYAVLSLICCVAGVAIGRFIS